MLLSTVIAFLLLTEAIPHPNDSKATKTTDRSGHHKPRKSTITVTSLVSTLLVIEPPSTSFDISGTLRAPLSIPRELVSSKSSTGSSVFASTWSSTTATTTSIMSTFVVSSTQYPQAQVSNPRPTPNVQACYEVMGGVFEGLGYVGCKSFLDQLTVCSQAKGPWTNPYDNPQSFNFQGCLCETAADSPFTQNRPLYQNVTSCVKCMETTRLPQPDFEDFLTGQLQCIMNFCRSQNPDAYLFMKDLVHWLDGLSDGIDAGTHPIPEVTAIVSQLQLLYTTTPPLANLAYGASALRTDGSLRDVTPSLTTFTTSGPAGAATVTSLVTWIPTVSGMTFDPTAASKSEAQAVSSAVLSGATSTGTRTSSRSMSSDSLTPYCHGPGDCSVKTDAAQFVQPTRRSLVIALLNAIAVAAAGM